MLGSFLSVIALIATLSGADAATYYVSTSTGNDSYSSTQAQSTSTPWKTINHAASNMAAGDTCEIMSGTYRETVTVPVSGTASEPITFTAYSGAGTVTIDGTQQLTGWTSYSPTMTNVWYTTMSTSLGAGNQVFVGSAMAPEARWPNVGQSGGGAYPWPSSAKNSPDWSHMTTTTYNGGTTNGTFTDTSLPTRANGYWDGCVIHSMSGYGWVMQAPTVTSYTDSTKTIVTNDNNGPINTAYSFAPGNEYYITGAKGEMDSANEWFYESSTSRLYIYATSSPTNVYVKQRAYGFNITGQSHINLTNLNFWACSIQTGTNATNVASSCTFNGLVMKYVGFYSWPWPGTYGVMLGNNCVLENSQLSYDSCALVQLYGSNISVVNDQFQYSGFSRYWPAMLSCTTPTNSTTGNYVAHNTFTHV
jgi:hypothetical protein